jgi:ABC transporter with metal-binding/Fe-S-binding domain ATP-binding protein
MLQVAVLLSGGKDSLYSLYIAQQYGWYISHVVSILSPPDSWMFHGVNSHLIPDIAKHIDIPFLMATTNGEKEKELDDLKHLLSGIDVDGVVSGAIASEYQRTRIEGICEELDIKTFMPLWHKNQETLLFDLVDAGFRTIIVAVAADGLGEDWLGKEIDYVCIKELVALHERYGLNVAGEGGEYETLVIDCPLYHHHLLIEDGKKVWRRDSGVFCIPTISFE